MKQRSLDKPEAIALIADLRALADAAVGPNPKALKTAKGACFLLGEQPQAPHHRTAKAREVLRLLEVLFSTRRWKEVPSVEGLRKDIKSACDRLRATFS